MHPLKGTSAVDVFPMIKDVLLRLNLNDTDARGDCYDGDGAIMGVKSGVSTSFKEINSKMLSIHCFGHALKLAVSDLVKNVREMKDKFDTAKEIRDLIKKVEIRNLMRYAHRIVILTEVSMQCFQQDGQSRMIH